MKLFIIIFVVVYGSMHIYVYSRITAALTMPLFLRLFIVFFMVLMVAGPIVIRVLEKYGYTNAAALSAYTGYTWMGLIVIFIPVSVLLQITKTICSSGFISKFSAMNFTERTFFFISLIITLSAYVYAFIDARMIRTERVTIKTPKLPKGAVKIKIAQISDVHTGLLVRESRLKPITLILKRENPDIIVSTGDLVDGQLDHLDGLSELFKALKPPSGKFAVIGNHELYAGLDEALEFTEKSGFRVLRNEAVTSGFISIAGVDDNEISRFNISLTKSETELLLSLPKAKYNILLKHKPLINQAATGLFDLQLSGHTHKGQIFPYNIFPQLIFKINTGFSELHNGSSIYVNRGAGTWGPPIRLLAPPEVTIIEIEPL